MKEAIDVANYNERLEYFTRQAVVSVAAMLNSQACKQLNPLISHHLPTTKKI